MLITPNDNAILLRKAKHFRAQILMPPKRRADTRRLFAGKILHGNLITRIDDGNTSWHLEHKGC